MEAHRTLIPAGEALAEIERLLDRVDPDRSRTDAARRLAWVRSSRRVRGRIEALTGLLTAEADRAKAAETAAGTPLASWLGMSETLSRREASGAVHQARILHQHPIVGEAAVVGTLGAGQARAIANLLDGLAPQLDDGQQARAEQLLVGLADHLDADELARSASRVLAAVAPLVADEVLEQRLQREAERAQRERSLRFFHQGGSVRFDGSLPRVEAEKWISQLDALAEATRRTAIERRDPLAALPTPGQRRADALIAAINAGGRPAARRAGDEPGCEQTPPTSRVIVTLDYDRLRAGAADAGVIGIDETLSTGELRRLCCDAEVIPVVMSGASQVLDVGRAQRLVTPAMRAALIAHDGGCVFPGCDAPPSRCEAHHVVPWLLGGSTALGNLVLLCHIHHPVVEPAVNGIRDQWTVRIAEDGLPEFTPPSRLDAARRPVRHTRHSHPRGSTGQPRPPNAA